MPRHRRCGSGGLGNGELKHGLESWFLMAQSWFVMVRDDNGMANDALMMVYNDESWMINII